MVGRSEARGLAIVINDSPLSPWLANILGLLAFRRMDLEAVHFDTGRLLRPGSAEGRNRDEADIDLQRLLELLVAPRPKYIFSSHDLSVVQLRPIREALKRNRVPWCRVVLGVIPGQVPPKGLRQRLSVFWFNVQRLSRKENPLSVAAEVMRKLFARLMRRLGLHRTDYPPAYLLLEGKAAAAAVSEPGATIIPGHSRDYETALSGGLLGRHGSEDFCVFLDANEPGACDWPVLGFARRDVVDEKWYLAALLKSFKVIEEATGLRVIVLAHPRYAYPPGRFGNHEVRTGETMEMVSRARLVLAHYSTAVSFAVIFNKPVVLLTAKPFDDLAAGWIGRYVANFQRALGCITLSMDEPDAGALRDWARIDKTRYAEYRDCYIKYPGSPDRSMWETATRVIAKAEGWQMTDAAASAEALSHE